MLGCTMTIYLQTSDNSRNISIPTFEKDAITLIPALPVVRFSLVNRLTPRAMNRARAFAKAHGLRIVNARRMAVSVN